MRVLIGSQALSCYIPDVTPKDIDYFSEHPIEGAETFYHPDLEQWSWGEVATLDELYTIKVSHIFWELKNGSWAKHFFHMVKMEKHGARFIPELYEILYPIWEERYGPKKANLNQSADEFFSSTVDRVYEHDSLHDAVSDDPMFRKILKDGSDVAVDREKFEALSYDEKIQTVREELYATALERLIIPSDYRFYYKMAYATSLKKMLTSYSKGWFALFVALNANTLRKCETDYVELLRLNSDRLIPLEG